MQEHAVSSVTQKKGNDLRRYYEQSFMARVGTAGVIVICTVAFFLTLVFFMLAFTYTPQGQIFLQHFKIRIFF